MEDQKIKYGNSLIAEFRNGEPCMESAFKWRVGDRERPPVKSYDYYGNLLILGPQDLKYHNDWEWLMPVVEKMCSVEFEGGRGGEKHISFQISNDDNIGWIFWLQNTPGDQNQPQSYQREGTWIERVFTVVIEFIEWYNLNKLIKTKIDNCDDTGSNSNSNGQKMFESSKIKDLIGNFDVDEWIDNLTSNISDELILKTAKLCLKAGYNKCIEINKERKYTKIDIINSVNEYRKIIESEFIDSITNNEIKQYNYDSIINSIIESLQNKQK